MNFKQYWPYLGIILCGIGCGSNLGSHPVVATVCGLGMIACGYLAYQGSKDGQA